MEGRAKAAAMSPQELGRTSCRATLEQATADAGHLCCIQCVDGNEEEQVNEVALEEPQWKSYWDDLTGRELNRSMVEATRAEELAGSAKSTLSADNMALLRFVVDFIYIMTMPVYLSPLCARSCCSVGRSPF